MARSAPIASAVRNVSCALAGPIETATISLATPFSFNRIASSTAISSNGFMLILTLARSTPEPSALTRGLTLKSITLLTATRSFMRRFLSLVSRRRPGPSLDPGLRRGTNMLCRFLHLGHDLPRRIPQIVGRYDRQAGIREDALALLDIGALEPDDERHV